jgi:hypothetical protein
MIETVVTIALLCIAVFGSVALVDGASGTTSSNKGREGATSLHRELLDVVRSIPYAQVTDAAVPAALQGRPGFADSSPAAGYTIARRGYVYTVEVSTCALDDPKDGQGPHDVAVAFCPDSAAAGTRDRNADDYRRVRIALSWKRAGRVERPRQTTVVTNPAGGLGPSVSQLTLTNASSPITDPALEEAEFEVRFTNTPQTVSWAVNGDVQGAAAGSGTTWTFSWDLGDRLDGTYVVQAQGFDEDGRSGVARKLTVVLDRGAPAPPGGLAGGRNGNGDHVDLEWLSSPEGDVVGYRVYRTDAGGTPIERACPPAGAGASGYVATTACVDEAAPPGGPLHYAVVALDVPPSGGLREGSRSSTIEIAEGNAAPSTPGGVTVCAGGAAGCDLPDGTPAPAGTRVVSWSAASDPDEGDAVAFYRVYRDGTAYAARYGRTDAGGSLKFVDTSPGSGAHDYRVTAVDGRYGESAPSGPVSG